MLSDTEKKNEERGQDLEFLADVPLEIRVLFGRTSLSIGKLLTLKPGSVITFDDKDQGDSSVEVVVNGNHVGDGEIVVVNDNYGVRVKSIKSPIPEDDL